MIDIVILMPTFNRLPQVAKIVEQLQQEAHEHELRVFHILQDDSSDWRRGHHPYKEWVKENETMLYKFVYTRNPKNYGRKAFWKTWNGIITMAKTLQYGKKYQKTPAGGWRYAIAIPDDHEPCKNFLYRVQGHFELIQRRDPQAVCMNLLVTAKRNWHRNRWVDGCFICTPKFFDALKWKVNPTPGTWFDRDTKRNPASSGVGKQMTDRLAWNPNYRIARCRNVSYLTPMKTPSVMYPPDLHPKRPKHWGLSRQNFIDREKIA
jgi:hypothetical protein